MKATPEGKVKLDEARVKCEDSILSQSDRSVSKGS